jgi:polyferredoxin
MFGEAKICGWVCPLTLLGIEHERTARRRRA